MLKIFLIAARSFNFTRFILLIALALCVSHRAMAKGESNTCAEMSAREFEDAHSLFQARQYLLSAVRFSALKVEGCSPQLRNRSTIGYVLAMSELHENLEGLRVIEDSWQAHLLPQDEQQQLQMIRAWILNEPSPHLTMQQSTRWKLWTQRLDEKVFIATLDQSQLSGADNLKRLEHDIQLSSHRSPWVAGIASSLIPGAGQAYSGSWQTAALSLILNATFLSTTIELANHHLPAAAITAGFTFSVIYVGNIVSAVEGANSYNQAKRADAEGELKTSLLPELSF